MKRKGLITLALLAAPRLALACPVCFGQSDAPLAKATNLGIIVMLVVVAAVLSSFAAFIVHLNRRARLVSDSAHQSGTAAAVRASYVSVDPQEGTAQC